MPVTGRSRSVQGANSTNTAQYPNCSAPTPSARQKCSRKNSPALYSRTVAFCRNSTIWGHSRELTASISSIPNRYSATVHRPGRTSAHQNSIMPIKAYIPSSSPMTAPRSAPPFQFCFQAS